MRSVNSTIAKLSLADDAVIVDVKGEVGLAYTGLSKAAASFPVLQVDEELGDWPCIQRS